MEDKKLAIEVKDVQKIYKLYDKPSDRMKEAFGLGKKKHKLHYALKGVNLNIIREKPWESSEPTAPVNPPY